MIKNRTNLLKINETAHHLGLKNTVLIIRFYIKIFSHHTLRIKNTLIQVGSSKITTRTTL